MSDIFATKKAENNTYVPNKTWVNVSLNIGGTEVPFRMGIPIDSTEKNRFKVYKNSGESEKYATSNDVMDLLQAASEKRGPGSTISLSELEDLFGTEVSVGLEIRQVNDSDEDRSDDEKPNFLRNAKSALADF